MPWALCMACNKESRYRGTRGTRLAELRCACGGQLRGQTAGRPSKNAGRTYERCAVCGRRRMATSWGVRRLYSSWRCVTDSYSVIAELLDGAPDEARDYPGQPGALVCFTHIIEVPPLAARWILETACAVAGWGLAPTDEELHTRQHSRHCESFFRLWEARREARFGDYAGCLAQAALAVTARLAEEVVDGHA